MGKEPSPSPCSESPRQQKIPTNTIILHSGLYHLLNFWLHWSSFFISFSGLELYGTLFESDGVTPAKFDKPLPSVAAAVVASAAPTTVPSMRFDWKGSPMDKSGILYYFGTNFGKQTWSNPSISGLVSCTASSLAKDSQPVTALTGREVVRLVTNPEANSW